MIYGMHDYFPKSRICNPPFDLNVALDLFDFLIYSINVFFNVSLFAYSIFSKSY